MNSSQEPRTQTNTSQFLNESNPPLNMLNNIKKDFDSNYYKLEPSEFLIQQLPGQTTPNGSSVLDHMKEGFGNMKDKEVYRGQTFGRNKKPPNNINVDAEISSFALSNSQSIEHELIHLDRRAKSRPKNTTNAYDKVLLGNNQTSGYQTPRIKPNQIFQAYSVQNEAGLKETVEIH